MRRTRRTRLITAALAVGMGLPLGLLSAAPTSAHGHGHGRSHGGPMAFQPIEGSAYDRMSADWSEPLVAPRASARSSWRTRPSSTSTGRHR